MNNRQADNLFQTASNQESIMPEVIHYPERVASNRILTVWKQAISAIPNTTGGWDVNHTVVSPNFRHRGIAKLLVSALMEYAETHNIPLTASCDYAARFIG